MNAPVAYFLFNRPRHTSETFAAIRAWQPAELFLIADGPRPGHPTDAQRCREVREVVETIDWPCQVHRDYADENLGLQRRISTGLDWVFSQAGRAIILEDDCLPSPEFFEFCNTILDRYEDNEKVWAVNGNSYQPQHPCGDGSYYFSKYPDCWGWATWRRAWRHYQFDLPFLSRWLESVRWRECFPSDAERVYWGETFQSVQRGELNSWAFRWTACALYGGGLSATPNANLVKNIGFGADSTNTKGSLGPAYDITTLGDIVHPSIVQPDVQADKRFFRLWFCRKVNLWQRVVSRVKREIEAVAWRRHAR